MRRYNTICKCNVSKIRTILDLNCVFSILEIWGCIKDRIFQINTTGIFVFTVQEDRAALTIADFYIKPLLFFGWIGADVPADFLTIYPHFHALMNRTKINVSTGCTGSIPIKGCFVMTKTRYGITDFFNLIPRFKCIKGSVDFRYFCRSFAVSCLKTVNGLCAYKVTCKITVRIFGSIPGIYCQIPVCNIVFFWYSQLTCFCLTIGKSGGISACFCCTDFYSIFCCISRICIRFYNRWLLFVDFFKYEQRNIGVIKINWDYCLPIFIVEFCHFSCFTCPCI